MARLVIERSFSPGKAPPGSSQVDLVFHNTRGKLRPPGPDDHYEMPGIDDLISRSALNFRDHRELLGAIPPRRREPSLQAYFW